MTSRQEKPALMSRQAKPASTTQENLQRQPGKIYNDNPAKSTSTTRESLHLQLGNVYIDDSAKSASTTWQMLSQVLRHHRLLRLGKRYIYKPAKNPARTPCPISSTNQDLPHDSASHPKARGLLSGIWDTGTRKEDQRGP